MLPTLVLLLLLLRLLGSLLSLPCLRPDACAADVAAGIQFAMAIGDNFYSSGIHGDAHAVRFKDTFENVFTGKDLQVTRATAAAGAAGAARARACACAATPHC